MERLAVLKTYKIFINGQFPRTESGRYYPLKNSKNAVIANVCLSSRKDLRNAIVAARSAFSGWSGRTAFNRSQILYRIAEMLENRKQEFISEMVLQGDKKSAAEKEVNSSIDTLIYYAGWCDKYQAIFSSVNPVSSSHFNFSSLEPMGVVGIIADEKSSLAGLVNSIAPCIAGANTCVVFASESKPLCAVTFAEVINTSDVPAGVINILTGSSKELISHFASHMDVNAVVYNNSEKEDIKLLQETSALNLKRIIIADENQDNSNPYLIMNLQEVKTTWHPIENIGSAKSGY